MFRACPGGGGWPPGGPGGGGGGLSFAEDCINFNWNQVEARYVGGEWKVVQGSMWMLSFGTEEDEANEAASIHFRFTEQCFLGRPGPSMTYWKRGGGVPSNDYPGDDCINNNPNTTQARWVGGEWKLADGSHWMVSFGSNESEARQGEELVRHYRLNRQCFVGRPNASMTYWLSQ